MGRLDLIKSLARSAAQTAATRLQPEQLRQELRRRLDQFPMFRGGLSDAELTKAIARAHGVEAATLQVEEGALVVQVSTDRGQDLALRLVPAGGTFAPHGAKELSFRVEPTEQAALPLAAEIVGAIGAAVAHALWGPFLRLGQVANGGQGHSPFVHRDGSLLTADLRTVPEVRAVMGQKLPAALLDAMVLESMEATPGLLKLQLGVYGL